MFQLNSINNEIVLNENNINEAVLRLLNYVYKFRIRSIYKFKTNNIQCESDTN